MPPARRDGDEEEQQTIAAVRLLADAELRARQAAATEAQVSELKEQNRLLTRIADAADRMVKEGGIAGLLRYIFDGTPPWARATILILFSLSVIGLSSQEILEVLRALFPAIAGGGGAPPTLPSP